MVEDSIAFKALLWYGLTFPDHRGKWRLHKILRRFLKVDLIDREFKVERAGFTWQLNPSDYVRNDLFWLGEKDRWEIYHTKSFLKQGDIIFDVGANFGYYSLILSSCIGSGLIYSFEPNPPTFHLLEMHVAINNLQLKIKPQNVGLSNEAAQGKIIDIPGNTGSSHVNFGENGTEINLTTLDSFCIDNKIKQVNFIKIDVEGFEGRMLNGSEETLKKYKPIIMIELQPSALETQNIAVRDVINILEKQGYILLVPKRNKLVKFDNKSIDGFVNAFCMPR